VFITGGDQVYNVGNSEANAAIRNRLQAGTRFHHIKDPNPDAEIWLYFKAGEKTIDLPQHYSIATHLGTSRQCAKPWPSYLHLQVQNLFMLNGK
jgi:hypothetical protein